MTDFITSEVTMSNQDILVVEDEQDILFLIEHNLSKQGYRVTTAESGEQGLKLATSNQFQLIILDLMLPGMNGLEVCKAVRNYPEIHSVPILMLTAKGEEQDIVAGLNAGADDYVTKPFSPKILLARIQTLLRRNKPDSQPESQIISIHNVKMDISRHQVFVDSVEIPLSATEFGILEFLAKNPGWVFTRNKIIDGVKGRDYPVTERSVDVQILGLRKKLGQAGDLIETVRGVGYRFKAVE